MAKNHLPYDNNQRVFGFVREHGRLRGGRPERVGAYWRKLPGPQMAPRVETQRDEGARGAAPVVLSLSVTVNVSIAL